MIRSRMLLAALALGAMVAAPLSAQVPGAEVSQVLVSRQALEDLALRLEQTAASRSFSTAVRNSARAQAAVVRTRLRDGDFQIGDRIRLIVDNESTLINTFTVTAGRQVALPGVGLMPMAGVLRVELQDHVTRYLSQYLRDPKVRAQALIRLALIGGVARQGYITSPVDIPMDSILQLAGGLSSTANVDDMKIERDGESLYEGRDLQRLISDGATPDALSLRQGDRVVIPQVLPKNPLQRVQVIQSLIQIPLSIYAVFRLLKGI